MRRSGSNDARDEAHWEAVEEAGELFVERDFQGALTELKRIIQSDANNPYAYELLGRVLWQLDQAEPAKDAFRAAVLLSPNFLGARIGLSHALRKLGDFPGAEQQARVATLRFPDDGDAYHALALALVAQGEHDEAVFCLEKFLDSKPTLDLAIEAREMLQSLRPAKEDDDEDEDEG